MRVLHIDTGAEMRGGQWQALYLMRGLTAAGQGVRLLAPAGSPLLARATAEHLDARALRFAALREAKAGIDLIHAHDARAHTLIAFSTLPAVVSRRVAFAVKRNPASRWKYRRPAHYIAVSNYVKNTLIDAAVPAEKVSVVYDGVPFEAAPPESEARTLIVALDSGDPGKGRRIIENAAVLARIPIHFSKNLEDDLPRAAVFVYITDLEGLGSAALLAMSAGVPVVASHVGGLPEIVEDGVNGLLTANEPQAVAKAIRALLDDRTLASRLAARGRMRVENSFSVDRMISETIRVYERILS